MRIGRARPIRARFEAGRSTDTTTSCVHYVEFPVPWSQQRTLARPDVAVTVGIDQPGYRAAAVITETTRRELLDDLGLSPAGREGRSRGAR